MSVFFSSCPSCISKCKQSLRNIFPFLYPKVTKNEKWDEWNMNHKFCLIKLTTWPKYRIMTLVGWICSVALKSWFCVKWTLLTISRNLELASTKPEIWAQVFKQPISLPIEIQIHYSATMTKVLLLWLDTHIYPQWSQILSEIVFDPFFCDFAISQCSLSTDLFYNHG